MSYSGISTSRYCEQAIERLQLPDDEYRLSRGVLCGNDVSEDRIVYALEILSYAIEQLKSLEEFRYSRSEEIE